MQWNGRRGKENGEEVFPSPVDWDHGEHDWGRKRFLRIFLSENPPLVNKIVLNVAKCCVIELLTHTHAPIYGPLSGTTRVSWDQKGKTNLDFTEARDSGISRAICKCAPRSREIATPAPNHSDFYRPDALPAAQPTASKLWRHILSYLSDGKMNTGWNTGLSSTSFGWG